MPGSEAMNTATLLFLVTGSTDESAVCVCVCVCVCMCVCVCACVYMCGIPG